MTDWFDLTVMDWFAYANWGVFAAAELLFIAGRISGEQYLDKPRLYEDRVSGARAVLHRPGVVWRRGRR